MVFMVLSALCQGRKALLTKWVCIAMGMVSPGTLVVDLGEWAVNTANTRSFVNTEYDP
jgi:hypothetical protein